MKRLDLPAVTRVHDDTGSHVEPPLEQHWDEATKLAWCAASIAHDTGLAIALFDEALVLDARPVPGSYSITVGQHSVSAGTYRDAWRFLNGVEVGADAQAAKEET